MQQNVTICNGGLYFFLKKSYSVLLLCALTSLTCLPAFGQIDLQITEIFAGQAGTDLTEDWFEIKNVGSTAWVSGSDPDLFYDDESASAADADPILGITDIQPGEVVIIVLSGDTSAIATFRQVWGPVIDLAGVEIGLSDGAGLGGGGDAVNIWVGNPNASGILVDTEAYPNTDAFDGQSYDVGLAAFSVEGNASGAVTTLATGGATGTVPNVGSPGDQAAIGPDLDAPVVTADSLSAAPFLQLNPTLGSAVGADLGDPTDPAATTGIPLLVVDANTPLNLVTLSASSSNQAVIPDANVVLTGSGANYTLTLTPTGVGLATITVTATDDEGKTGVYTIDYAASDATVDPTTTRFHHGAADGSTALEVDEDYMWVGDDEDQTIRLYDRAQSGLPLAAFDFNGDLGSSTEADLEGSFRDGSTLYWMGSHATAVRSVIFATEESGSGASATLSFLGAYRGLRADLLAWDANNVHGMGANFYGLAAGFEIEALSVDPNNSAGALLGFRAPSVAGEALVLPVTNFKALITATNPSGEAVFGTPFTLDLQNRTLRSLACNADGCLVIGGPVGTVTDFRLYTWTGNPADEVELRAADLSPQANLSSFEGIVALPNGPFLADEGDTAEVQFLVDTGTFDYYGTAEEAKDLSNEEWRKFRSELVTLGPVETPPIAAEGDLIITEILQDPAAVTDENGEWFEIYNATPGPIDLRGWTISDLDIDSHVIDSASNLTIAAGEYLVLGTNGDVATNGGVSIAYVYSGITLANGIDELILTAPDGVEIDRVAWDDGATFPDPMGASMSLQANTLDNSVGNNWCTASTVFGVGDLGTPGMGNDCAVTSGFDLQITEMWPGQDGADLTADWFEITNFGSSAWTSGVDPDLFYDDESQDPAVADLINGISDIQPGESVIIMVDGAAAVPVFQTVWSVDYDLTDVKVGWADGSGLGQGGDGVTLFVGTPSVASIADFEAYPGAPSGLSYDVVLAAFSQEGVGTAQLGSNVAVATTATAGSDGLEPAIASPGNKGPLSAQVFDLQITEMFPGQAGDDLTADWFELTNEGNAPWVAGVDADLYYDDESFDPAAADLIQGLTAINPGESAIVLVTDNVADLTTFAHVWGQVIDLTGVEIGFTDGSGLGGGGDAVGLFLGDPTAGGSLIDTASYPDTDAFDGQSFDVELAAFSVVGNANGAVQTIALGGDAMDIPNIGSPGNGLAIAPETGLEITEIFPGQAGDDLTEDWFEITNKGTQAWVAGVDSTLFYDDESADPATADPIIGITDIQPGETVIVLLTDNPADLATFRDVWGPVIDLTDVEIGYADGAGLGGGGDAVTLWLGNPTMSTPIDTASYPDTDAFDGQSFDSDLGVFSVVGNANGAVQTLALGGNGLNVPNIGSPGNGLAVPAPLNLVVTEIFPGQSGDDLTEDWFEIRNDDSLAWIAGMDPDLYYDDESAAGGDADLILGISAIQPGESVIVLVTDNPADIQSFRDVWGPVIDLAGVQIGYTDGAGLGGGGDAVTLWLGDPNAFLPLASGAYPDTDGFDGQSFDVELGAFSVVGNANGAVQTLALGGNAMDVPNIGSPGNGPAIKICGPLPAGFANLDIGNTGFDGEVCFFNGMFDITASGSDIYRTKDGFNFTYTSLDGDGEIIAEIVDIDQSFAGNKAGVMIRETLDRRSKQVFVGQQTNGDALFKVRSQTGGRTKARRTPMPTAANWVKIVRTGNTFQTFLSQDGVTFTPYYEAVVVMDQSVWIGLATTTAAFRKPMSYTFDQVSIEAGSPMRTTASDLQLQVWPNPTQGRLQVELGGTIDRGLVQILDLQGKVVWTQEVSTTAALDLDLSNLAKGMYRLQLTTADRQATQLFVKQ